MSEQGTEDPAMQVWTEILRNLEQGLGLPQHPIERSTEHTPAPWNPPDEPPIIPRDLEPRARQILSQQLALLEQLRSDLVKTRKHLDYLKSDAARGITSTPRFIDRGV